MKNWMKKCMPLCGFIPITVLAVCTAASLSNYTAPVLTVEMNVEEENATEEAASTSQTSQKKQKTTKTTATTASVPTVALVSESSSYQDGTYTGTGTGFSGPITVQVVIQSGKIKDITITSTTDDSPYIDSAAALLKNIISTQSTNVDTVSGATYSSVGLIEAVRNALQKAGGDSSANTALPVLSAASVTAQNGQADVPTVQAISEPAAYQDGTYTGTGTGFSGPITVEVIVQDGKISDISILSTVDDSPYIDSASALLKNIVLMQSTNVDTVSGATYSSAGLIEAVRNALVSAEINEISNSSASTTAQQQTEKATETTVVSGKFPYQDGIYMGTGEGYRGEITVAVVLKNNTIDTILVLKTEDDEAFFQKAEVLVNTIVKKQTTDVDVVSGATFSSEGILEAIENALSEAKRVTNGAPEDESSTNDPEESSIQDESSADNPNESSSQDESSTDNSNESSNQNESSSSSDNSKYIDGDYVGIAICYPNEENEFESYELSVTVRIQDGKIVEIVDVGSADYDEDNEWYINRAVNGTSKISGVVSQILENQTTDDVDIVSGATCSSDAIIQAVLEALECAHIK